MKAELTEVMPELWVGSAEALKEVDHTWAVVHAARDPWHRDAVKYKGMSAPKASPEYLYAQRKNELCLNWVDADDPKYFDLNLTKVAISFIKGYLINDRSVLIHCNEGLSRGPGLAMAYMAPRLDPDFASAVKLFTRIYPYFMPRAGILYHLRDNWATLRGRDAGS